MEKSRSVWGENSVGYLSASIMLEVTTNLTPAMFSMARLVRKPAAPARAPRRKQRVHLRTT